MATADERRDKKLSYSLHGLQQAILRAEAAHWHREEDTFIAIAEAVSWVVTLDSILVEATDGKRDPGRYKSTRAQSDDGKTVIGMRFVRHNAQHAAELLDFVFVNALVGNSEYGLRAFWMWTPLHELEPFLDPEFTSGKGLYDSHLGGKLVLETLLDANRWFVSLTPPLPPLPPDPAGVPRTEFALPTRWPPVENERSV